MTEEKHGAAEWLRGIVKEYEASGAQSCSAMARMFGIDCEYETCRWCMTMMLTAIADRIDAEQALPEGIEWPRFEDGELVKIGDEVEFEGETAKVLDVAFNAERFSLGVVTATASGRVYGDLGERVKRPTPKVLGADGAPIEVGDTVYFADGDGSALIVERIDANGGEPAVDLVYAGGRTRYHSANPENLTHERPDSWERIEKDAAKPVCEYAGAQKSTADPDRYSCIDCLYDDLGFHTDAECNERMRLDLVRRAKALAKAGEQA